MVLSQKASLPYFCANFTMPAPSNLNGVGFGSSSQNRNFAIGLHLSIASHSSKFFGSLTKKQRLPVCGRKSLNQLYVPPYRYGELINSLPNGNIAKVSATVALIPEAVTKAS